MRFVEFLEEAEPTLVMEFLPVGYLAVQHNDVPLSDQDSKSHPKPLILLDLSYADEEPDFLLDCGLGTLSENEKRYRAESMRC